MTETASAQRIGNLPSDATSFIGRRREVLEARRLLYRSRLLTLTGAGGVGKSRLALRVASGLRQSFVDEVWWVPLATLEHGELLAQTVADTVGLRQYAGRGNAVDSLVGYLSSRKVLLVLDNCEHLLEDCAALIDTLLTAVPGLRILATSRQAVGVPGEQIFVVPSLSVPQQVSDHDLTRFEAINLFVERTSKILPKFRLGRENREAVVGLCRRLDGIPLAIELAAVRLRTLPIRDIIDRLGGYFDVLTAENGEGLRRHQTLHATLDWSFDLCSPQEQALWARLSVFTGGVEMAAVEEVCADDELPAADILDAVSGLVDKSILIRSQRGEHARYHMLETIRQYGRRVLVDAGREQAVRRRHRDWCLGIATESEKAWTTSGELSCINRLNAEYTNLRTALDYCFATPGEATRGLVMAAALGNYWYAAGSFGEANHWLGKGLELVPQPTPVRAKALWAHSRFRILRGEVARGRVVIDECHQLGRRLHDDWALAAARQITGLAEALDGDYARAAELLRDALARFRRLDDPYGVWYTLYLLANGECLLGRPDLGVAGGEECLALSESRGAEWSRSQGLWVVGLGRWWEGDHARAAVQALEALRLKWRLGDQWGTALSLETLAWTAAAAGHHKRAAQLLGAADAVWQYVGASPGWLAPLASAHQWCEAETRQHLGNRAYRNAFRHGTRLSRNQAISYALGENAPAVGAAHAH